MGLDYRFCGKSWQLKRLRGGAVWQLVGLITRRSQVQILPPLPILESITYKNNLEGLPATSCRSQFHCGCPRRWSLSGMEAIVGWATRHIAMLRSGHTVSFRPKGQSMRGRIESGQLCTVTPIDPSTLSVGDI